jgi:type I restriction enzyme R subunit
VPANPALGEVAMPSVASCLLERVTSYHFIEGEENLVDPEEEQDRALAALTELFNEVNSQQSHVIVERIVADIDGIVKQVRFPDWQNTTQGEREVRQVLRRTLLKYKLHTDQELFDKAYGYIREYY